MTVADTRHPLASKSTYACETPAGARHFWPCAECRVALGRGLMAGSIEPIPPNVIQFFKLTAEFTDRANIEVLGQMDRMSHGGMNMDALYSELWLRHKRWLRHRAEAKLN